MAAKRTPVKFGERIDFIVFLTAAKLCIKFVGGTLYQKHQWYYDTLYLNMKQCVLRFAPYDGNKTLIYFPHVNRCHPLGYIDTAYHGSGEAYCGLQLNGVASHRCPDVPDYFADGLTAAEVCTMMCLPPVDTLRIHSSREQLFQCQIHCSSLKQKRGQKPPGYLDTVLAWTD